MKFHPQTLWFHSSEFVRACEAVASASPTNFMDAGLWSCKYIQIFVDQRTKSFIFRNGTGDLLTHETVYALFPTLRDEWPSDTPDDGPVEIDNFDPIADTVERTGVLPG